MAIIEQFMSNVAHLTSQSRPDQEYNIDVREREVMIKTCAPRERWTPLRRVCTCICVLALVHGVRLTTPALLNSVVY